MPDCWNDDCEHYSLRYALGNDLYILKCVIIDGSTALFNLYNASRATVSNVSFELREVITYCSDSAKKKLVDFIPKIDVHIIRIREELIMPVAGCYNCTNEPMPRRPDPMPMPRVPGEFKCLPNPCNYPPEMGFEMPNRGLLVPVNRVCCGNNNPFANYQQNMGNNNNYQQQQQQQGYRKDQRIK